MKFADGELTPKELCLEKDSGLSGELSIKELPKIEEGGGPAGVKEPVDEGGGPAGVVEGIDAPNEKPLLV